MGAETRKKEAGGLLEVGKERWEMEFRAYADVKTKFFRINRLPYNYLTIISAPTLLVVSCLDVLLPVITRMINCSLTSGHFPDS